MHNGMLSWGFSDRKAWKRRADFAALSAWLVSSAFMALEAALLPGVDFRGYYAAARVVAAGGNPYDYSQLAPILVQATGFVGYNHYYYPPWFAWCFTPISWLPYQTARWVWILFNLALWIVSLWQMGRLFDWPEYGWRRWLMFLFATYAFAHMTFQYEQFGIVLFALLTALLWAVRERRWNLAGVLMALLLAKPHITAFPVLAAAAWLARKGHWKPLAVMCMVTAGLLIAATLATPGWYNALSLADLSHNTNYTRGASGGIEYLMSNTTLLDWLKRFGMGDGLRRSIYYATLTAGVVVVMVAVMKSKVFMRVIAVSLLAGFAATPYARECDFPSMTLVFFWATASLNAGSRKAVIGWAVLSIAILSVAVQERQMSYGYWIVIGLIAQYMWSWRHAGLREALPEGLLIGSI